MSSLEPRKPSDPAERTPAQTDALMVNQARELATAWAEVEKSAVQRVAEVLPGLDKREVPAAARHITTARAIAIDKHNLLAGKPTSIVEHRSTGELIRALGGVVDGTADEIQ